MAPRAQSKFGAPMFETEVFRKQMYSSEESTCDIVWTFRRLLSHSAPPAVFWRPHSDSAPGELRPCPPRYAPILCLLLLPEMSTDQDWIGLDQD